MFSLVLFTLGKHIPFRLTRVLKANGLGVVLIYF